MAKINCDVDGPACAFVPGLWDELRNEGFDPLPIDNPKWRTWDLFTRMDDEMREAAFRIMEDYEFWASLPLTPGAQEAIAAFREAGHRIHWITTAWDGCDKWRAARRDWLEMHFGGEHQNICTDLTVTGDKSETWADVFIDDKPSAIIDWHRHHPAPQHRGILYKTNFNYHHHDDLENITWSPDTVNMILGWLEEKYGA